MTLTEFNDAEYMSVKNEVTPVSLDNDDLSYYQCLINSCKSVKRYFDACDTASVFGKAFPDIVSLYGKTKFKEAFYAIKNNGNYKGVPNEFVYLVNKGIQLHGKEHPNRVLNSIMKYLKPYKGVKWVSSYGEWTPTEVVTDMIDKSYQPITSAIRANKLDNYSEVYISNVGEVALIPNVILMQIATDDLSKITYDKKAGLSLDDKPLRTYNPYLGITRDDFDLREVM